MATYTYTTTQDEDAAIAHVLATQNATRADQGIEPISADGFVAAQLQGIFASWGDTMLRDNAVELVIASNQLTAKQKLSLGVATNEQRAELVAAVEAIEVVAIKR